MKTKLLALFLALVMVVLALASCTPAVDPCPPHLDDNGDGTCDKCQEKMPDQDIDPGNTPTLDNDLPAVSWDVTSLLFSMSDNSNNEELSSGCRRYLSGERLASDGSSSIYDDVDDRNGDAEDYAMVDVEYTYYSDTSEWRWGKCATNENGGIYQKARQPDAEGRPDMFCNFVYDMVSASLLECFNNLYTNKLKSKDVDDAELQNYFAFAKDGKYDITYTDEANDGKGYMVEYMQSLTLSEEKMYLVASDYFIDLVRAFFVVPVNVSMIEKMQASEDPTSYFYDYVDDDVYTIADFYELVNAGRWTYEAVKAFSEKMYQTPSDSNEVLSGKWGFALASGGVGGSGILYTTSITIIQREVTQDVIGIDKYGKDIIGQVYNFYYPDNFTELTGFIQELYSLFGSTGVTYVEADSGAAGQNSSYNGTSENAVRDNFSAGNIGFGGIVCVGSLEGDKYSSMTDNSGKGFGIVPVPLYQQYKYDETLGTNVQERYLTQIHNIGRVGAIGIKTEKFAQCTAFLNYQSLNSTDILNSYYDWTLKGDVAGAVEGNSEMLDYIRYNVRSSFDKAFEDAVARQAQLNGDSTLGENKWHNVIIANNYRVEVSAMNQYYDSYVSLKAEALEKLEASYAGLTPDPT